MDLFHLYHRIVSRWRIVLAVIVGCLILAGIYLAVTPRIYSSRAVLQVRQPGGKLLDAATSGADDGVSPEVLKTVEQNLTSQSLLLRVVHTAHLADDAGFAPPKSNGASYLDSELLALLQSRLSIEVRRGTRLIDVMVEDRDPVRAERLARALVSQYLEQSFEDQLASMKTSNGYLSNEVQRFWPELPQIEKALAKNDPSGLLDVTSVVQDPEVADLQERIHVEEANFASLKEVFMENHPRYQAMQRRLEELHEEQDAALLRAAQRIENSYQNTETTETEFANRLQQQEQQIASNGALASYETLAQNVESDRALYDAVLARMRQTSGNSSVSPAPAMVENAVQIVEEPLVSAKPVKPRRSLVLAAALLAGLVLGVGIIFGEDYIRSAFTNVYDIESSLGVPVLAAVPKVPSLGRAGASVAANPNSVETEAFRTLRAAIHLLEGRESSTATQGLVRNAVLFTSANPGEGKTTCAYNYAVMLARQGLRTLLVDADLRRATLTLRVASEKKLSGLADVLAGRESLSEACRLLPDNRLSFLSAGRTTVETAEHFDSAGIADVLHKLSSQFDRIVIDTPPVNVVSDSLLIVPHVLMNCLIIQAGATQKRAVAHACGELKKVNRGIVGAILNQVGTDSRASYECYGYAKNFTYTYNYTA
jgi:polysaccharide biosynthesis transport protein